MKKLSSEHEVSVKQEVNQVGMKRPHVVVLGAGASRAVCPKGDKNGKILPLMADFSKVLEINSLLEEWGIDPNSNLEEVFSDLFESKQTEKIKEIQSLTESYFKQLRLPDQPTIYDHLVLSLREKDVIATFNWDPLLIQAYLRNQRSGLSLPKLSFLHGNVSVGICEKDKISGVFGRKCSKCGKDLVRTRLFYPIRKKDYAQTLFIENEWRRLEQGFTNAFMITIFGYSGPKTDEEAIAAMKKAWGDKIDRNMEQTAFITTQKENQVIKNWEPFIHTHHYEIDEDFYDSWIANHPRRTGEAYTNQYYLAKFIENNPVPKDLDFEKLWKWYQQFKEPEKQKQST